MRDYILIPGLLSILMLMSCNSNLVFEDFESGSLQRWKAEGDPIALAPSAAEDEPDGPVSVKDFKIYEMKSTIN